MLRSMDLVDVYQALGQERSNRLIRTVSIGALKTFGVYEAVKVRSRLQRLNRQKLRLAAPKLWQRISEGDAGLARDIAQAVLVSNIPMIVHVLEQLGIEHDGNGFFDKDGDYSDQLGEGWQDEVFAQCRDKYDEDVVLLYINHLGWETRTAEEPFLGGSAGPDQAGANQPPAPTAASATD